MRGQGLPGIGTLPLIAAGIAAACAVMLGGGAATAAPAGNHIVYSDPVGDNQSASSSNYAADIQQVEATSQDNGQFTIAATLASSPAKLVDGESVYVFVDIDRNQSTGQSGFEYEFKAEGSTSGAPTFFFCTLVSPVTCQAWSQASDTATSTSVHVVTFSIATDAAAFDFGVVAEYAEPGNTTDLFDEAPNSGLYSFNTLTDPDHDGKYGTADHCPTVAARGKFDKNNNGCAGPFPFIGTKQANFTGLIFPGFMRLKQVRVTGAPTGSKVVFSSPKGGDSARANSSGTARSRRIKGDFRYGSVITIRITKPAFVGVFLKEKIVKSGLKVLQRRCIPAVGGSAPVTCSGKLKGS